jgi:predicted membrane GTPase involved in stress response
MEVALEFCHEDESVEVTFTVMRIRKVVLNQPEWGRLNSRAKKVN